MFSMKKRSYYLLTHRSCIDSLPLEAAASGNWGRSTPAPPSLPRSCSSPRNPFHPPPSFSLYTAVQLNTTNDWLVRILPLSRCRKPRFVWMVYTGLLGIGPTDRCFGCYQYRYRISYQAAFPRYGLL